MRKPCTTCKHDHGRCAGKSRKGGHQYCWEPQTNGDRIREMSDEELADTWMRDFVVCHRCAYRYECECDEYVTIEKCREGIVEWLKQPLKEEE